MQRAAESFKEADRRIRQRPQSHLIQNFREFCHKIQLAIGTWWLGFGENPTRISLPEDLGQPDSMLNGRVPAVRLEGKLRYPP